MRAPGRPLGSQNRLPSNRGHCGNRRLGARSENIYESVANDRIARDVPRSALVEEMVRRGWLGDKTGQGFYKRVKATENAKF